MLFFGKKQGQQSRMFLVSFLLAFFIHGVAWALVLTYKGEKKPVLVSYISASMVMESINDANDGSALKENENVQKKKNTDEISVKKQAKTKPDDTPVSDVQNSAKVDKSKSETSGTSSGRSKEIGDKNLQKYIRRVVGLVNNKKFYPKESQNLREQGLAVVQLVLDKSGKPLGVKLKNSSGYSKLDEASLRAINSVSMFPAFPDEVMQSRMVIEIPMRYKL